MSTTTGESLVEQGSRRSRRHTDGLARPMSPLRAAWDRHPATPSPNGKHRHPDADRLTGAEHCRRLLDLARAVLTPTGGAS